MKTKSIKSRGTLVLRGSRYYAFWRVKDANGDAKAISKALRDENGAPITTRPEAERAKARLMEIVNKKDKVESLVAIQHAIDDKQKEIQRLEDEQYPPLKLTGVWTAFLQATLRRDCAKSTLVQYEIKWQMFHDWMTREHSEILFIRDIDNNIASAYLQSLNHGTTAPATFNFHLNILRYIWRVLKPTKEARLAENVWLNHEFKTVIGHSRRELTIEELRKVCGAAEGELKLLFAIGTYTGLRLGDAATLKWSETDLLRCQIRRVTNKTLRRFPKPVVIPIHPVLAKMLAETPANERDPVYVLPETAHAYGVNQTRVNRMVQAHFKKCGIETQGKHEHGGRSIVLVGFHSLRHTFVSMAREAGAPLSVVESIVGHHSVAMTRHYTHTSEQAAQSAVGLLPSINGATPALSTERTRDESLRELIGSMTAKNFREKKAAALAMLSAS